MPLVSLTQPGDGEDETLDLLVQPLPTSQLTIASLRWNGTPSWSKHLFDVAFGGKTVFAGLVLQPKLQRDASLESLNCLILILLPFWLHSAVLLLLYKVVRLRLGV